MDKKPIKIMNKGSLKYSNFQLFLPASHCHNVISFSVFPSFGRRQVPPSLLLRVSVALMHNREVDRIDGPFSRGPNGQNPQSLSKQF